MRSTAYRNLLLKANIMNKFLQEILEQPGAVENLTDFYLSPAGESLLKKVKKIISEYKIEQIICTGMGSSYFMSHAASCLYNELKIYSFTINASELLHYNLMLFERETLLICASQSGDSFEIKEILTKLPANVHCIGIVNEEQSALARKAEIALLCKAGREEKTSTKTYTATSLVSFILGWYLAGTWNEEKGKIIRNLAFNFRATLSNYQSWVGNILAFLGDLQALQIIARGPAFSTACQSALMFREALHIPASGTLGGEFRHGPMEMVSEGFKAILFAAKGKTFVQSIKMARDIAGFGGKVLLITNKKPDLRDDKIMQIFIDEPDEFLFSVHAIVPVQLFIDQYAKLKGFEAGSFSRGAKVTETE
jgi:glucosamine--fructose-6-phosphate aminotransferase (isomerizing)